MDPRRAADPRLARDPRRAQDPRLARTASADPRARSDSPAPPPALNVPVQTLAPQPLSATPAPASLLSDSTAIATSHIKQRPLFCVVCASNQVRQSFHRSVVYLVRLRLESLNGSTLCAEVSPHCETPLLY